MNKIENKIHAAVEKLARQQPWGRGARGLVALRVSGGIGLSGIWQCYVPCRFGGQNSVGEQIRAQSEYSAQLYSAYRAERE